MSLFGLDIGTTGCKAVVYSTEGTLLKSACREYAVRHEQPGWAELDSWDVWNHICEVLSEVAAAARNDPIRAISVSSLGEAMVPVSNDRNILDNSILCMDSRGQEYVEELHGKISQRDFYAINPNRIGVSYSMPKLRWIKEHRRDMYDKADWLLSWADFACFMLGSRPVTDSSLAARTLLLDLKCNCWSQELLRLCCLEDLREKLPPIVSAGEIIGTVSRHIAEKLGFPNDVKIIAGGHDQCCNALGSGVQQGGQAVYGIGTFECITPVFDDYPDGDGMLQAGLSIENHVVDGKYVTLIYNQGGSLVKWFRETFVPEMASLDGDIYLQLSNEMPFAPTHLFTLPYFEPTGPPEYVVGGPGVILGLKTTTTRGEILKSIMESVTYYQADVSRCLGAIGQRPESFVATGGGAKSDRWLQIKADIFGVPFIRNTTVECSALGAAMLAGRGAGLISSDTGGFIKPDQVFEPDMQTHKQYCQHLVEYRDWVNRIINCT